MWANSLYLLCHLESLKKSRRTTNSSSNAKTLPSNNGGPLDEENLETNVTSWLYQEEDEEPIDIPKKMYPKSSIMVDKMGYKGHYLGLEKKEENHLSLPSHINTIGAWVTPQYLRSL